MVQIVYSISLLTDIEAFMFQISQLMQNMQEHDFVPLGHSFPLSCHINATIEQAVVLIIIIYTLVVASILLYMDYFKRNIYTICAQVVLL